MLRRFLLAAFLVLGGPAAAQPLDAAIARVNDNNQTRNFYQQRGGAPAWTGSPQAQANARLMLSVLSRAADEGLDPGHYQARANGDPAGDVALTAAALSYMRDLAVGRPELQALDRDVLLPPRSFDAAGRLNEALQKNGLAAMLASVAPPHPEYAALRKALADHPDAQSADIIRANMERWRWLSPLEPDRIMVNSADASLQLWLGGKIVLESRVIVGKPKTPTPILRAEGAGLTVNPPWNVPQSIAAREILPKLKRDPSYLAGQDMVLLNGPPGDPNGRHVNWKAIPAGTFPYRIRQHPGPKNPLGQIKLELPNRFDVYLHDTPGKTAFDRPSRAQSHGCVRVEQILPLASYALAADLGASEKIAAAIGTGQTQYIALKKKLPVYFLYWTAVPAADGTIAFHPDIYGRDRRLIAAMRARQLRVAAIPTCQKG
jgi:murein L,D-transpeptidase YcbB/YkuD